MAKSKKYKHRSVSSQRPKAARNLYLLALLVFAVKMIIMFNIPHGGWYGADGEN
jgi:ABC-type cobalt transport system substrate-binding protein